MAGTTLEETQSVKQVLGLQLLSKPARTRY